MHELKLEDSALPLDMDEQQLADFDRKLYSYISGHNSAEKRLHLNVALIIFQMHYRVCM